MHIIISQSDPSSKQILDNQEDFIAHARKGGYFISEIMLAIAPEAIAPPSELVFLTNVYDISRSDAQESYHYSEAASGNSEMMQKEWDHHVAWVKRNITGLPVGTNQCNQQQLIDMGLVGIYTKLKG